MTFAVALVFSIKNQSISLSANGQCGRHFVCVFVFRAAAANSSKLKDKLFQRNSFTVDVNSKFL